MRIFVLIFGVSLFSCVGTEQNESLELLDSVDALNGVIYEQNLDENKLDAVSFNNELTLIQEALLTQVDQVFTSDSSNIEQNIDNALFELELKGEALSRINAPDGGTDFKNAVAALIAFYKEEFQVKFPKLIPLIQKKSVTPQEQKTLDEYDRDFAKQEEELFMTVFEAQTAFSLTNKMRLEER